ncbi:MAG: CRISPR-associated endonuclease Cas2 [Proteobacteria bacterium]|nr:CRISPR-associated endonuclease Cas2 [Pseudomonadota bacterium]
MTRTLYIVAYDISNEKRLAKVRYFIKNFSTGGQRSVYECFLTDEELERVTEGLKRIIHPFEDRIHIFTLDGRSKTHTLGIAIQPQDPDFFYIG